jgi:hypothetical protein
MQGGTLYAVKIGGRQNTFTLSWQGRRYFSRKQQQLLCYTIHMKLFQNFSSGNSFLRISLEVLQWESLVCLATNGKTEYAYVATPGILALKVQIPEPPRLR